MKMDKSKKTIAILTGGKDVPGLNPAIRAITYRALAEGYEVIGLKRGFSGILELVQDKKADNSTSYVKLTEELVNKTGRTGGTFLHTSKTIPSRVSKNEVPDHLKEKYTEEVNDLTNEVIDNLGFLGIDYLILIGGDETLKYAVTLYSKGVKVIGIPKTMDNDVPGTDYCIGYSTCITRVINMTNRIRTSAGSHEGILVLEVFGQYSGFSAMLPTMVGVANRCVIPEYEFEMELLTELLCKDREKNPSKYSILLASEGARFKGAHLGSEEDKDNDPLKYAREGGISDAIASKLHELVPGYNNGKPIEIINQKLGYIARGGDPDSIDSIVPMAYGNQALDLVLKGVHGRLIVLKNGRYDTVPLDTVVRNKKRVDVRRYYNTERLRPHYKSFEFQPLFIMSGTNF